MSKKSFPGFDLNSFCGPFRKETDRACAVLGAAMLDALLGELYKRRLHVSMLGLLSGNEPLSRFSARINLARALGWLSEDVCFDLNQIRAIRNGFAHSSDHHLSFNAQSVADRCKELRVAKVLIDAHEHVAVQGHRNLSSDLIRAMGAVFQPARARYEVTVEMLAQHLCDLEARTASYSGPDLRKELWDLGTSIDFKIEATGTVSPGLSEGTS